MWVGGCSRVCKGGRVSWMSGARVIVRGCGNLGRSKTLAPDHVKAAASVARQRQTLLRRASGLWRGLCKSEAEE
jgi:hypothetical protein